MKILEISDSIAEEIASQIQAVFLSAFGIETDSDFLERANEKKNLLVTLLYVDDELAGFKIGYTIHRGVLLSWLGAVPSKFQRQGFARSLIQHQHASCAKLGYSEIQTEAIGDNKAMLLLNIQEGFTIFGSHLGHNNELSVRLRKLL
jgi:GNAT superfamily N-acetyltransferase